MCPKNFKSFHNFFFEKRRVKCKKNTFYRRQFFAYLFFIGENNEWIKKIYYKEMCGFKCSILIYIYLLNCKNFFWNLHFARADNTFTCVWERGSFQDPGIQFSLGSNDGNFRIILKTTSVLIKMEPKLQIFVENKPWIYWCKWSYFSANSLLCIFSNLRG